MLHDRNVIVTFLRSPEHLFLFPSLCATLPPMPNVQSQASKDPSLPLILPPTKLKMPPSTHQDRELARRYVLALGVREAARQLNLNEDTVSAWSARFKWLAHRKILLPKNPIQANASSTPDPLLSLGKKSKLSLAIATQRAADKLAVTNENKLVRPEVSQSAKNWTSVGQTVFGWQQEQPASGVVSPLSIYSEKTIVGFVQPNECLTNSKPNE